MTGPATCAMRGCRIRGRHLPTCPGDCDGCLPRATEHQVCDACADRAERQLAEIERLAPDARAVARGEVRRGTGGGGGKPGSRPPINDGAWVALEAVQGALTTITRDIAETRGLQFVSTAFEGHTLPDPLVEAAQWLSGQMSWLRGAVDEMGQPYAVAVFAEIADCARVLRSTVDGPREQRYLGPCGADRTDVVPLPDGEGGWGMTEIVVMGEPCEGDVYGPAGGDKGTCRTCGAQVDQGERRAWLDAEVTARTADTPMRARDIAHATRVNVNTIRTWSHGGKLSSYWWDGQRYVPWVEPREGEDVKARGPRLHYVSDVMELVEEADKRRVENEARRARREGAEMGA